MAWISTSAGMEIYDMGAFCQRAWTVCIHTDQGHSFSWISPHVKQSNCTAPCIYQSLWFSLKAEPHKLLNSSEPVRRDSPIVFLLPCQDIVKEEELNLLFSHPWPRQISITVSGTACMPSAADRWDLPVMQSSPFVAMATKSPACCRLSCQPPPPCSSSPISAVL